MSKYTYKEKEIELCDGDLCIHRFRCYRHSLYQDARFKGFIFLNEIDSTKCRNPENEDILPFHKMWLPENIE